VSEALHSIKLKPITLEINLIAEVLPIPGGPDNKIALLK
jgi:hypothetical protein